METVASDLAKERQISIELSESNAQFKSQIEKLAQQIEEERISRPETTVDDSIVIDLRAQVERLENTNITLTSSNDSLKLAMEGLKQELEQEREDFKQQKQTQVLSGEEEIDYLRNECQRIQQERNDIQDKLSQLVSDYEAAKTSLNDVSEALATHKQERLQEVLQYGEDRKRFVEELEKERESLVVLQDQFNAEKYVENQCFLLKYCFSGKRMKNFNFVFLK